MEKPDFSPRNEGPSEAGIPDEFNPWRTIWTSPRMTVRSVIAGDPMQWLWVLMMVGGTSRIMARVSELPTSGGLDSNTVLSLILVGGPIAGLVLIFGYGRLLHLILKRVGGTATWVATRTGIVWSLAPGVPSIALWGIMIAAYGLNVLSPKALEQANGTSGQFVLSIDYFVQFALTMWSFILEVIILADVHRLSAWRVLLAELALGLALIALAMIVLLMV